MTDITFITSNQTKLAHARYLCRNYQVNILHYKKFFYGKGYDEPRIYDREQLLTESFKDAVARWKKNVSGSDDKYFFIEDTSVRIDALSDEDNEVPGVDVKYWMQNACFEALDRELKSKGNNRKCSVSSHIILFLTDNIKSKLGISDDYKIFTSISYGTITEKEDVFDTQMLYPWLDNKTFNKWFVPEGFTEPVSKLCISDADKGDFRKEAFGQMLKFLKDNGEIREVDNSHDDGDQLNLRFYDSFVVCGRTCAGKTTIGKYLAEKYGYYHLEASDFMTLRLLETHGSKSNIDKHNFASEVLLVEPLFVVRKLIEYMHTHGINDKFVVTGFRTKNEVEAFMKGFQSDRLNVVFVNSDFEERFKRWRLRHRDVEEYTEKRFKEIDSIQESMGIKNISDIHGIVTVDNNIDGLSYFYNGFQSLLLNHLNQDNVNVDRQKLMSMKISLEKTILVTLAVEYQKDDSKMFTTTEISHMINQVFKCFERNKNNVSRYFNQSFYIYYEVKYENRKNKYRLSPIGYSEALMIIRNL